jgi:hypothetical protein
MQVDSWEAEKTKFKEKKIMRYLISIFKSLLHPLFFNVGLVMVATMHIIGSL